MRDRKFAGEELFDVRGDPVELLVERLSLAPGQLKGQVAFITGGARGIGREVAAGLVHLGAKVAILDKRASVHDVAESLSAAGGTVLPLVGDICLEGVLEEGLARCEETLGPPDILVNNAVEFEVRAVRELSVEDWDYTLGTNVRACLVAIQAVLGGMLERGHGVILNMVAPSGIAFAADMSASKAALRSLMVSVAAEVGEDSGVAVYGFLPGLVATELVRENFPLYSERLGLSFRDYVLQTRPNPGYPGLMPASHCGAAVVHTLVHAETHHGLVADAYAPLIAVGLVDADDEDAGDTADRGNAARLRDEVREVRRQNERLGREVLRASNELRTLASIVESSGDAIVTADVKGCITSWNHGAADLFGYSADEVLGQPISLLSRPQDLELQRAQFLQALRELPAPFDAVRVHKDGSPIDVNLALSILRNAAGEVRGTAAIIRDIRARKASETRLAAAQTQLRQQARMAAMGKLAGGIAHDFNNMLMVILASNESVLDALGEDHPLAGELQDALGAARRTRALTKQLLTFSRKEPINRQLLDLDEVVRDTHRLLARILAEDIHVALELGGPGLDILMDRHQLEQVILNLAVNARDAMPDGGWLTLSTASAGDLVELRVRDTGLGMTPEVKARAFEPFFTTKDQGKGSGMGLAMVYGIVHGLDGSIRVESAPGAGAEFRLLMPRAPVIRPAKPERQEHEVRAQAILLVEDEPLVRRVTRRMLRRSEFTVLEADCAETALGVLKEHAADISVMVTDIVMPGWSGPELAKEVARLYPHIGILYISGYADDPGLLRSFNTEGRLLAKPFTVEALLERIRALTEDDQSRVTVT